MVDYATRTSSSGLSLQEVGVGYHHGLTEVVTGEMMAGGGGNDSSNKKGGVSQGVHPIGPSGGEIQCGAGLSAGEGSLCSGGGIPQFGAGLPAGSSLPVGEGKQEVGLLQLCGGMVSSISGKVAQSGKRTDVTPGVGGGILGGGGQPVGMPIPYGSGYGLTGGGQPEAGNLFGPGGRQRENVRPSNEVATIASGKVAVSSGPSYQVYPKRWMGGR